MKKEIIDLIFLIFLYTILGTLTCVYIKDPTIIFFCGAVTMLIIQTIENLILDK